MIFVVGLLVAVAVPRFIDLSDKARTANCKTNQAAIECAVALAYVDSAANGNAQFPVTLEGSMFKDGRVPTCPGDGSEYLYDSDNGTAACNNGNPTIRAEHNDRY